MCAQHAYEHMYKTDVNMCAQSRDEDTNVQDWDVDKTCIQIKHVFMHSGH
jgi:hypothetical protein